MTAPSIPEPSTNEPPRRHRVFMVDDHSIVRLGLRRMLETRKDIEFCGEASSSPRAFSAILECEPDLVILDISLANGTGLELVKDLKAAAPRVKCLMLSIHDPFIYAERAEAAGAWGYVCKTDPSDVLSTAIDTVLAGRKFVRGKQEKPAAGAAPGAASAPQVPTDTLTDRELEVFQLIGQGFDKHEIASMLGLSVKTVETHREGIKRKFGISTVKNLLRVAVQAAGQA